MSDPYQLSYFISQKNNILVVNFIGPFVNENVSVIEDCTREISQKDFKHVILSLRDVPQWTDRKVLPSLARLQKVIREKPGYLKIAAIHPELRKEYEHQGLIRADEVYNNLNDALHSVLAGTRVAA